ncbi:hypothetical protein Ancab_019514 [Ancistrocladus abbreviatus]
MPSIHADRQLINQVCLGTVAPDDYCLPCLLSNPRSPSFGVRELAGTAIFCAYNQSTLAQGAFQSLASQTSNPGIKAAYSARASITVTVARKDKLNDAFKRAGNPPLPADLEAKFKGLLALVTFAEHIVEQIR